MPSALWIVIPLEILLLALGSFACEVFAGFSLRPAGLRPASQLLLWAVEAAGLAGLFLIARSERQSADLPKSPTGAVDERRRDLALGFAVGAAAWIFRGPVVGTTLLASGVASRHEVWTSALAMLGSYLACGWALGASARWSARRANSPNRGMAAFPPAPPAGSEPQDPLEPPEPSTPPLPPPSG